MIVSGEAVTTSWLQDTLGWPAASVSSVRIGTDRGFAGVVLRLEITPDVGPSSTAIAKVGPDPSLNAEIDFYRNHAPALDAPTPRCLYAGTGANSAPLLLLEDLGAASAGDALAGASVDDVAAVLESMVPVWRHHAEEPLLVDLPKWGGDPAGRQARFAQNWAMQRDVLAAELPADILRTADRLATSLAHVAAELESAPARIVHADLHLDNVLFRPDGPTTVLDWGSACAGSPAVDIFPFITFSLPPEEQQRHGADLVDRLGLDAAGIDDGRRRLLCALAGVIGWRNRAASGNPREHALRIAALADGRLINAVRQWDAARVLP